MYGLYAGLKRMFSRPIFLKKTRMKPTDSSISVISKQHKSRPERTDEVRKSKTPVSNDALDLMELRQMRRIHRLVPEHSVDREELRWPETIRSHLARAWHGCGCVGTLALEDFLSIGLAFLSPTPRS